MCFSIEIDKDIKKLAKLYKTSIALGQFHHVQQLVKTKFQIADQNGRVFPNYFAPVITHQQQTRIISPMRYRIRPWGSESEVPNKFNLFNARIDSLTSRKTWKNIFLKKHGIVPLRKFYEWVADENNKPKLISFFPENMDYMLAPCLYDFWQGENPKDSFYSFAIITTDPSNEISKMGHDRSPVNLNEKLMDQWLKCIDQNEAFEILSQTEKIKYHYQWVD